jgi:methylmalonyl-CoA carboxyltransferase small subunit
MCTALTPERNIVMEKSVDAVVPGLCARVVVSEGDKVVKGQEVAVINCMKTEISVPSEWDGIVTKVLSKEWDELEVGTPMVMLDVSNGD